MDCVTERSTLLTWLGLTTAYYHVFPDCGSFLVRHQIIRGAAQGRSWLRSMSNLFVFSADVDILLPFQLL